MRHRPFLLLLAALSAPPSLTACAGTPYLEPDGTRVRHYVGYVRVGVPQAAARSPVYTSDVAVYGLRAGGGLHKEEGHDRDTTILAELDKEAPWRTRISTKC